MEAKAAGKPMRPLDHRRRSRLFGYNWPIFCILAIGSLMMLFPFVWMILSAFKTRADVYAYPPRWLPSEWSWDNFRQVFEMIPFLRYYANSIITSVAQTALQIVLLRHGRVRGDEAAFSGQEAVCHVHAVEHVRPVRGDDGAAVPRGGLEGRHDRHLRRHHPAADRHGVHHHLLMSFIASIRQDLIDSARLDGCGHLRVMTKVVIPNIKGAISTATLFAFLGNWKSYTWPLIVTNRTEMRTLPIGLNTSCRNPPRSIR